MATDTDTTNTTNILPKVNVRAHLQDQSGTPIAGAVIRMVLTCLEKYQGLIVPREVRAITDENGSAILQVFPNELGSERSSYTVHIEMEPQRPQFRGYPPRKEPPPAILQHPLRFHVVVPNVDCNLFDIVNLPPSPYRGAGEVLPAEVAGYAYDAASSMDQAREYAAAAATSQETAATSIAQAEAVKTAAQASANASAESARQAKSYVDSVTDTVATFEHDVVTRTDAEAGRLITQATERVGQAQSVALEAIEGKKVEVLNVATETIAAARTEAVIAVTNVRRDAVNAVQAASETAKEELREMAAEYDEDWNEKLDRADMLAKRAGCYAAAAAKSAQRSCECKERVQRMLDEAEEVVREVATDMLTPQVVTDAVQRATSKAEASQRAAAASEQNASRSEQNAKISEISARNSAQNAKASEIECQNLAIGVLSPYVVEQAIQEATERTVNRITDIPEMLTDLAISTAKQFAQVAKVNIQQELEIDEERRNVRQLVSDTETRLQDNLDAAEDRLQAGIDDVEGKLQSQVISTAQQISKLSEQQIRQEVEAKKEHDAVRALIDDKTQGLEKDFAGQVASLENEIADKTATLADSIADVDDKVQSQAISTATQFAVVSEQQLRQELALVDLDDKIQSQAISTASQFVEIAKQQGMQANALTSAVVGLDEKITSNALNAAAQFSEIAEQQVRQEVALVDLDNKVQSQAISTAAQFVEVAKQQVQQEVTIAAATADLDNKITAQALSTAEQFAKVAATGIQLAELRAEFTTKSFSDTESFTNLSLASVNHTKAIKEEQDTLSDTVLTNCVNICRLTASSISHAIAMLAGFSQDELGEGIFVDLAAIFLEAYERA